MLHVHLLDDAGVAVGAADQTHLVEVGESISRHRPGLGDVRHHGGEETLVGDDAVDTDDGHVDVGVVLERLVAELVTEREAVVGLRGDHRTLQEGQSGALACHTHDGGLGGGTHHLLIHASDRLALCLGDGHQITGDVFHVGLDSLGNES